MKYRELTPSEIEAYDIGYKVGNRKIVITDIEWESENEHKIYRKGYMAGLMDYKRNVNNVSIVSKVNNVEIETPTTSITSTTPIGISISKGNMVKDKFNEDSIIYVNGQYFDEFPSECMPLLKKYWSVSEIEEIRKNLACQPDHETTVAQLLLKYKPKKQEDRTLEIQFNTFWEVYPKQRKAGKTKPREKFFQIVKSGNATAEQIIKSAEDYAKTDEVARGFAKEPYSWLLNERYLCDYTIKQPQQMPMTAKERQDMINKQKTEMLLKQLKAQGN